MLGHQQHQLFQFFYGVLVNFFAHQAADIELGNQRRQAFARGAGDLFGQRRAGF